MKVHHLNCGTMHMPTAPLVCHVLLVETDGGLVLVDTGFGLQDIADPGRRIGPQRFVLMPMAFWLNDSDAAIQLVCWAGAGFALMLTVNLLPRVSLVLIYALYLSLFYAGQTFMSFQWDMLLVETGFAAAFLAPWRLGRRRDKDGEPPAAALWLLRFLLFHPV